MRDLIAELRDDVGPDEALAADLDRGRDGPTGSRLNAERILVGDARWKGQISTDTFSAELKIGGRAVEPHDLTEIHLWLDRTYRVRVEPGALYEVLCMIGARHAHHPVRAYLERLEWDGHARIDTWLTDFLGVPDVSLARALARKFLVSMVARVMRPGCQVDTTLVLAGLQGAGKSTACKALVGADWYSNTPIDIGNKDSYGNLRGIWLYEIAELQSFRGRAAEAVKAYISTAVDRYRPPYGRVSVTVPRQTVFVGTTNQDDFLEDVTGHRRFWAVPTGAVDVEGLGAIRDQLWAEAVEAYTAGDQWWLTADEARDHAAAMKVWEPEDSWTAAVLNHCRGSTWVTIAEVATSGLSIPLREVSRREEMRIAGILKRSGWVRDASTRPVRWYMPRP